MPVYIRKGPLEIPPYEEQDWIKDEDGDYFLKDPDQILDSLPQPFRMISNLINLLFDRTWETIEEREATRAITIIKSKPTVYLPTKEIKSWGEPSSIAVSKHYVFVALSNGIKILNVLKDYSLVRNWEMVKYGMMSISATEIGNEIFVTAVDEIGVVRIFYFYKDILFLIKAMNEVEDISKQTPCLNLKVSPGGDFMAILFQGSGSIWLEVYRLPKENWIKEVEQPHLSQSKKKASHLHLENYLLKAEIKFSSPIQILKLKPPKPVTGTPFKSPVEVFQKIEDVYGLGSGQNHMIRDVQLEQQAAIFDILFRKFLPLTDPEQDPSTTGIHFLLPGHIMMLPSETKGPSGMACVLGVHWPGRHNFFLYSLFRPPRDKEKADSDMKPEGVWPTASPIIKSAISPCSSFVILVCEDGVITMWNRAQAFLLGVISLPEGCSCRSLHFLKNYETLEDCPFPEDVLSSKLQVLVLCTDGSLYLVNAEKASDPSISVIVERPVKHPNETICVVAPIPFLTPLILLCVLDGSVYIMNVTNSEIICELVSPASYMANPWEPVFAFIPETQSVFIRGDLEKSTQFQHYNYCLFIFELESCQQAKTSLPLSEKKSFSHSSEISSCINQLPLVKRCEFFLQNRLKNFDSTKENGLESLLELQKSSTIIQKENRKK
ncbi:WD repeat-containing protein 93 isoform X2 [Monodelphis domestica]|uniref:WD repeat-containing protein 93 isoform X2 n=1 Tax=Monodelphis domestica TaxID=13616 RepID=UPI0004433391|nr:WD repeat-containing protein 93 isoform X2 [Monodelphis domestica]